MISIVYFVLSCCRPSTKGSCPPTRSLGQQRVFTAEARLHTAGQRVFTANARPHTGQSGSYGDQMSINQAFGPDEMERVSILIKCNM